MRRRWWENPQEIVADVQTNAVYDKLQILKDMTVKNALIEKFSRQVEKAENSQ